MIRIASRRAKRVLAAHLAETCPEHLGLLMQAGETFGGVEIQLPEDDILRAKLEKAR